MRRLRTAVLTAFAAAAVFAVSAVAFSVIQEPLPAAFTGQPYVHQFRVRGGNPPYTFTVAGKLPPGLALGTNGWLTGSPTATGSWQFYVEGSYVYGFNPPIYSQRRFTLDVLTGLAIRNPSLRTATQRVPYEASLTASGGGSPAWSIKKGRLPPGLALARSGHISGVPTKTGDYTVTVVVSDGPRVAEKAFLITVTEALRLSAGSVPQSVVGSPFKTTLHVSGGARAVHVVRQARHPAPRHPSLARGSRRNAASGGSPRLHRRRDRRRGQYESMPLTIVVRPRLKIPRQALAPAVSGREYRARIVARGGAAPLVFELALGHLPPGVSLSPSGVLEGTPRFAGRYTFTIRVADRVGGTHQRPFA